MRIFFSSLNKGYAIFFFTQKFHTMDTQPATQSRGQLTERVKRLSKKLLGYEIEKAELRLMPYIIVTMMDEQRIEPERINQEERAILAKWRASGHIEGGASGLAITHEFWKICSELVFLAYVDRF